MTVALALLQAGQLQDNSMYIVLGILCLLVLVALGFKFWRNMFEVITAPAASLGYHGQNDNFFFSLVIVILGGLIGTFILINAQNDMTQGFHDTAVVFATAAAEGGSSTNYRDVAANWGTNKLDDTFNNNITSNLSFYPVLLVLNWIFVGFFAFLGAKMFGGHTTLGTLLGSFAYPTFFLSIGLAAFTVACFGSLSTVMSAFGGAGASSAAASGGMNMLWTTVGFVLLVYGIILWFIALAQGGQVTIGGVIGVLVVLLVVNGGLGALAFYQGIAPWHKALITNIQSIDPSKPGFQMPE
jgi:hypothetical protein